MASSSTKISIQLLDGSKIKNALMQIDQSKGRYQLYIYEAETSRKPKYEFNLIESIAELSSDPVHQYITISSPKDLVTLVFNDPLIAQSMIKTLNSKSDISHDIDSIKILNEQVKNIWPFPA